MRKVICILLLLFNVTACRVGDEVLSDNNHILEENNIKEAETAEWINPYAENYRKISKQILLNDLTADYSCNSICEQKKLFNSYKDKGVEICIAIVTVIDISETSKESIQLSSDKEAVVSLKIQDVLENNGIVEKFNNGQIIDVKDCVQWKMCSDGTYEITFFPSIIPLAEVGANYIVSLHGSEEGVSAYCLSLPFGNDNSYIDTVAVGKELYRGISNETLWYYDINSIYYMEYLENNPDIIEIYNNLGVDLYDKESVLWEAK